MSQFKPRWSHWTAAELPAVPRRVGDTPSQPTCRTSKRPSAGSAGALVPRSNDSTGSNPRPGIGLETGCPRNKALANDLVAAMTIAEFARAGLVVTVRSKALNCRVLFVSDNVPDQAIEAKGLPVYRAAELRKLAQLRPSPGTIGSLHEIKVIFGGTIEVDDHDD